MGQKKINQSIKISQNSGIGPLVEEGITKKFTKKMTDAHICCKALHSTVSEITPLK